MGKPAFALGGFLAFANRCSECFDPFQIIFDSFLSEFIRRAFRLSCEVLQLLLKLGS